MIRVPCLWPEITHAVSVGVKRHINAVRDNRRDIHYAPRPTARWDGDINGAIGEMAFAKHLNWFWSPSIDKPDKTDVGPYHVRAKCDPVHRLVILPEDPDDGVFVSVLLDLPICYLCGWMIARDVKQPEWMLPDDYGEPRYFAPNKKLEPMETLPSYERVLA